MEPYLDSQGISIALAGDLNWEAVQSLERVLGRYPYWTWLELDLSQTTLVDSVGLVFMARLLQAGHSLKLLHPPAMLAEIIHMTGLAPLFEPLGLTHQPIERQCGQ